LILTRPILRVAAGTEITNFQLENVTRLNKKINKKPPLTYHRKPQVCIDHADETRGKNGARADAGGLRNVF
jgi:hypothetical protein